MSSPQAPPPGTPGVAVLIPTAPTPQHAFGWPPGSIRAILTLLVVTLVCALLLLGKHGDNYIPIPAYLLYLLFLAVGYYFGARGHSHTVDKNVSPPLYLPRGSVRLIILAALVATISYKVATDRDGLFAQLKVSFEQGSQHPLLPLVGMGGFLVGAIVRTIIGRYERSAWAQNLEAWFALIAVLLMCIAVLIDLVIKPSLPTWVDLPTWEGFLGGVVAFYFGIRS